MPFPTEKVIHVGDEGVDFQHTALDQDEAVIDLALFTTVLRFTRPDGTSVDVASSLLTDGSDGIHRWISTAAFFLQAGAWRRQALYSAAGYEGAGDRIVFEVEARLPAP